MRKLTLLFSVLALAATAHAQTVATFDDLTLSKPDTSYISYYDPGADVGFNDGLAHFPCVYDTSSFGNYWGGGFSYSNWADSVTSGYMNEYAAKTAKGYAGSANYAVIWCNDPATFTYSTYIKLNGSAIGQAVKGFYITNSTYAYNDMRDGNPPFSKKFGGTTGNDPDWFLLTVYGYSGGVRSPDSVNFYLADYRFAHNDSDYIVKAWEWVDLLPLGHVDSLQFSLSSSDTGAFGMNTPAYFCMDNFTTNELGTSVHNVQQSYAAKVYPNPATNMLYVDLADNTMQEAVVLDMAGNMVSVNSVSGKHIEINTATLPAGMYMLQLTGNGKSAGAKFVKE